MEENAPNYKILMADDEPYILEIMAKKIAQAGYKVVTAPDGEEALAKIKSEDPDIILLDLNMPKMDGFEVLKNLRENPPSKKWQPVIIISARTDLDDMKKGFSLEADHYLTKPCNVPDILKAIRLMINLIPQRKSKEEGDK
jgi:DNA-binding response OmpR family regulator